MDPVNASPGVSQHAAELVVLNGKLQYDAAAQLQNQSLLDNQEDSRGWSQLKLRIAQNAATVDHFVNMNAAQSTATAQQTGQTDNEQSVSPVRTATGDAIVGGVGVSAEQVAANVADLATSLVPVIASALATAISQSIAALVPVVVTAAGGASTPSQTQAKPTS
jgi:hypothetical protein